MLLHSIIFNHYPLIFFYSLFPACLHGYKIKLRHQELANVLAFFFSLSKDDGSSKNESQYSYVSLTSIKMKHSFPILAKLMPLVSLKHLYKNIVGVSTFIKNEESK